MLWGDRLERLRRMHVNCRSNLCRQLRLLLLWWRGASAITSSTRSTSMRLLLLLLLHLRLGWLRCRCWCRLHVGWLDEHHVTVSAAAAGLRCGLASSLSLVLTLNDHLLHLCCHHASQLTAVEVVVLRAVLAHQWAAVALRSNHHTVLSCGAWRAAMLTKSNHVQLKAETQMAVVQMVRY